MKKQPNTYKEDKRTLDWEGQLKILVNDAIAQMIRFGLLVDPTAKEGGFRVWEIGTLEPFIKALVEKEYERGRKDGRNETVQLTQKMIDFSKEVEKFKADNSQEPENDCCCYCHNGCGKHKVCKHCKKKNE